MSRYHIIKEETKNGRSKLVQYCVYDNLEDRVIVRYAKEADAKNLIDKYQSIVKE